jgi:hypothetical protein
VAALYEQKQKLDLIDQRVLETPLCETAKLPTRLLRDWLKRTESLVKQGQQGNELQSATTQSPISFSQFINEAKYPSLQLTHTAPILLNTFKVHHPTLPQSENLRSLYSVIQSKMGDATAWHFRSRPLKGRFSLLL